MALIALPLVAQARGFSVTIDPGVAIPLSSPQSDVYDVGGGQSVKAHIGIRPYLDLGPTATFLFLPSEGVGESGVVWGLGGGARLKLPYGSKKLAGISPWLDLNALYVRTGDLNRPGFDAALGLSIPVDEAQSFRVGPFVRYLHVFSGSRDDFDTRDAKILSLGLSFEFGTGIRRHTTTVITEKGADRVVTNDVVSCPDRDADTIPDDIDHCPDVKGGMETWGCPQYSKIVVKRDKLELKEKLYFAWNEARLEDASFPVLDEVVQALKDNQGFRVQVDGHSDSSGADDHNQTLSERRAEAVVAYLIAHGISKDRLVAKGFSSSVPTDTNETVAGRENNRRVEFVVYFIILNEGETK